MFGYIVVNQQELQINNYKRYRAYYCGLCRALKERYGIRGQATLSYDMTFLMILLNGLYEPNLRKESHICVLHPMKLHQMYLNSISEYVADMGILLSYYNLMDDWKDDKNRKSRMLARGIKKYFNAVQERYPEKAKAIEIYVKELASCEAKNEENVDLTAGLTGTMLAELFVWKRDIWEPDLRRMGFFMGKFIYLMDAFEDVKNDTMTNNYNPWKQFYQNETTEIFEKRVEDILILMMSDCAHAFEKLPIVQDAEILRNIIYAGVWSKYEAVKIKRHKEEAKK